MFEKFEINEAINLVFSSMLFIYFIVLSKRFVYKAPKEWIYAIICLLFSGLATVTESFFAPLFLNILEHLLFSVASFLLFIGIYKKFIRQGYD